jgi:NAD+ synthase (glutamine-hydrolysing)
VGFVEADRAFFNAAAVCADGAVAGVYRKCELPNYAVFDELRYFVPGSDPGQLFRIAGLPVGVSICEDAWNPAGPIAHQATAGARLVVNLNASPYAEDKLSLRELMLSERAAAAGCPLVYVNQVGGQDELVFDGASMVFDGTGRLVARAEQFAESVMVVEVPVAASPGPEPEAIAVTSAPRPSATAVPAAQVAPVRDPDDEVYDALVLGTRDYVEKNGFRDVVVALSGGIDSTLVAVIAVDALGADRVHGVSLPSRFSSDHSRTDAAKLASNLGIDFRTIAIEPAHAALLDMLAPSFEGTEPGLTEENIQSRIRGQLLMALSNKFGWLVLTTGNKSEMAVGYATLYGDTCGGYAVIKDVLKTRVFELCRMRNRRAGAELVPEAVITKPPSAELRPDQRDDQSLPPYEVLDEVLRQYVEQDHTVAEIIASGVDAELTRRIARLVDVSEYKRRQTPPGPRVTGKAFGKDRRLPITNGYPG